MVAVGFISYLLLLVTAVGAVSVSELVGTWTTKSESVITGPVSSVLITEKKEISNMIEQSGLLRSR